MHQVSWAESAGAQAGAQASGCEGVKVGNEPPADKFWEEAEPGCWKCVSVPCWGLVVQRRYQPSQQQPSPIPYPQFQYRAHSPPSQELLENQEGPRGRGRGCRL